MDLGQTGYKKLKKNGLKILSYRRKCLTLHSQTGNNPINKMAG